MSSRILLAESQLPRQWYNLAADLPRQPLPPLGRDGKPVNPQDLAAVFPMNLIEQEMSRERWIPIPEEVLEILRRYRPTPLHRARALEAHLKTPARIYFKNESVSPAGSHKVNTAVAQAYYNKQRRREAHHHRDRRGPVGQLHRLRLRPVRPGVQGLHGAGELRPEARAGGS